MKKSLIAVLSLMAMSPAIASELGMSSSYGSSFRNGTGSSAVYFQSTGQLTETNYFGSYNVRNTKSSVTDPLVTETTLSATSGARNFTESTTTTGRLLEDFTFGGTSTTNFTGVFAR
jgi:hypothetical protein